MGEVKLNDRLATPIDLEQVCVDELDALRAEINSAFDDGSEDVDLEAAFASVARLHALSVASAE